MATLATSVAVAAGVLRGGRRPPIVVGTLVPFHVSPGTRATRVVVSVFANGDDDADAVDEVRTTELSPGSFPSNIREVVQGGVDESLRFVDAQLALAMKGEAADATGDDGYASEQKRTASVAESEALAVITLLKAAQKIRGFGAARLVPKRDYALSELKLNDIEADKLLSPTESTISGIRDWFTRGFVVLVGVWIFAAHPDGRQIAASLTFFGGAVAVDQIGFGGGIEALALDTAAQATSPQVRIAFPKSRLPVCPYKTDLLFTTYITSALFAHTNYILTLSFIYRKYVTRLRLHEAAHFLVAYLMGILPKGYTLSSKDAWEKYNALNVQAGCAFCDGEFQEEVALGKITSASLGKFACVALAGIGMEYVEFGFAEGGVSDVRQLDGMLRALAFSQKKSDSEVRWAVLNVISILRRHKGVVVALAETMATGATVGECVKRIEQELGDDI